MEENTVEAAPGLSLHDMRYTSQRTSQLLLHYEGLYDRWDSEYRMQLSAQ